MKKVYVDEYSIRRSDFPKQVESDGDHILTTYHYTYTIDTSRSFDKNPWNRRKVRLTIGKDIEKLIELMKEEDENLEFSIHVPERTNILRGTEDDHIQYFLYTVLSDKPVVPISIRIVTKTLTD